jgi:hypothetical protein
MRPLWSLAPLLVVPVAVLISAVAVHAEGAEALQCLIKAADLISCLNLVPGLALAFPVRATATHQNLGRQRHA